MNFLAFPYEAVFSTSDSSAAAQIQKEGTFSLSGSSYFT